MKKSRVLIVTVVVLLMGGVTWAQEDPPVLFVSDPDAGEIYRLTPSEGPGEGEYGYDIDYDAPFMYQSEVIFADEAFPFEGLVYGPDGLLYACNPEDQTIIRFSPWGEGPVNLAAVEIVFSADVSGEDLFPQCGQSTFDQGLVFTDTNVNLPTGVWVCEDVTNIPWSGPATYDVNNPICGVAGEVYEPEAALIQILAVDSPLEGVTQEADGDLLIADFGGNTIWTLPLDVVTNSWSVGDLDSTLMPNDPIDVARFSTGEIFASSGNVVLGYQQDEYKEWLNYSTCDFIETAPQGCLVYPFALDPTASDVLFATSAVNCSEQDTFGFLWALDIATEGSCTSIPIPIFWGDRIPPTVLWGLALAPTSTNVQPATEMLDNGDYDLTFNFNDHIHAVTAGEECLIDMTAFETPPGCLESLIPEGDVDAEPVFYLGEDGFGIAYHVWEEDVCEPPSGGYFLHAISAYTPLLDNPTIVRCDGDPEFDIPFNSHPVCAGDFTGCEFLPLTSFFPFDGDLPDDGRIGSRGSASFSLYFLVDYGLAGDGAGTGSWCGFKSPVNNVATPDDPGMSTFSEGRTVPLKFKVTDGVGGNCKKGPFLAPEGILLSIARVRDDFEVQEVVCVGGGCGEVPYFDPPNKAKKGFHMNIRTDGFEAGIYQATLVATGGEFPVAWTYFEIVE